MLYNQLISNLVIIELNFILPLSTIKKLNISHLILDNENSDVIVIAGTSQYAIDPLPSTKTPETVSFVSTPKGWCDKII